MQSTWLIAGLGNPGEKYANTRHNAGFMVVDEFALKNSKGLQAGQKWKQTNAYASLELSFATVHKVILLKPLTFMNNSGAAVRELVDYYKIPAERLIVVHDEVDLPFAVLKLKNGGGDGGHNGIKSVVTHLSSTDFMRLRFGVGRPDPEQKSYSELSDWVLAGFTKAEDELLKRVIDQAAHALETVILEGLLKAQTFVNRN